MPSSRATPTSSTSHGSVVRFERTDSGWFGYYDYLRELASRPGMRRVCEIGGGANPALPMEFVREHDLEYTVLDISAEELAKAPDGYVKLHADIMNPGPDVKGGYDLVFSRFVAEHVRDGKAFHQNVRNLLVDGGLAFHFYPTLYALPYLMNLLMPERISDRILHVIQEGRENDGKQGKFPAHYSWCRGPIPSHIVRLERLGYDVEEFIGYYGHSYYARIKPLHQLHEWLCDRLVEHPVAHLTTMAYLLLRRRPAPSSIQPTDHRAESE